jgi:hypothetical protein
VILSPSGDGAVVTSMSVSVALDRASLPISRHVHRLCGGSIERMLTGG